MITAKERFQGSIEVGSRTCEFTALGLLKWACSDRPELIELDRLDFSVHVYDEDDNCQGNYSDMDAPDAERSYWEQRIKVQIKRDLEKKSTADFEWVHEDGSPFAQRDLLG